MDKPEVVVNEGRQHPYARAREAGPLSRETLLELVLANPGELKRLNSWIRHLSNRQRWRILTQHRCALIAITLRACERAIGSPYAGRERGEDRGWILFARDDKGSRIAVMTLSPSNPKSFDDFKVPLELTLLEPPLFNLEEFEAWRHRGLSHRPRKRSSPKPATRPAG